MTAVAVARHRLRCEFFIVRALMVARPFATALVGAHLR
jgi:hypothetical protein